MMVLLICSQLNINLTKGVVKMNGYKVVNYNVWECLPEIFNSVKDAKEAKSKWCFREGAIIEQFKSKNNKAKRIIERSY